MSSSILKVNDLSHAYGKRMALDRVSFEVSPGQIFGFLGPNGGGKTTLFKILSTMMHPSQGGRIECDGVDLLSVGHEVRKKLGVVFQSPSLDKKLTVQENLMHQGHLYGLQGKSLLDKIHELLEKFKLLDRKNDLIEKLSGGLQRRVEIAKALLHSPKLLLLDEPTTGLDPASRLDIWSTLKQLKEERGVTCLLTTHLIEEAEKCDQIGILNLGKLIALDTPSHLKREIGGDVLTLRSKNPELLKNNIEKEFLCKVLRVGEEVRVEREDANDFLVKLMKVFAESIDSVTISKPTLEDVFIQKTGHKLSD